MFINFKIHDLNQVRELKSENKMEKERGKKGQTKPKNHTGKLLHQFDEQLEEKEENRHTRYAAPFGYYGLN